MQTPRPVPHDPAANLVVYSAAFKPFCQALLAGFAQAHPGVRLQFIDAVSTELHTQYLSLHQSGQALPDVIWSSAMDLQMDLVRMGHASPHRSAHAQALPNWARYSQPLRGRNNEKRSLGWPLHHVRGGACCFCVVASSRNSYWK